MIDGYLAEGMSGAGVSRSLATLGLDVSPDVINRHKKHYEPEPDRPANTRKRDFAIMVRDKAVEQLDAGQLDLRDKDTVPGINAGLKADAILKKQDAQKRKMGHEDVLASIIVALRGEGKPIAVLDDGMTIEGTAVEVTE